MKSKLPKHIAIIMDGNRRWARLHNLPEIEGHRMGTEALIRVVEDAGSLGIKCLTVYALSSENLRNRSKEEVKSLLHLLKEGYSKHLPRLKKEGIRLNFIGRLDKLPRATRLILDQAVSELKDGEKGILNIAINYGGRGEILNAVERASKKHQGFSEKNLEKELYTVGMPDPDLLIRTGGQKRLSNFLLWQLAYSELYFTDKLWPDFDRSELSKATRFFQSTKRNFGT